MRGIKGSGPERLVTGSDDFLQCISVEPSKSSKHIARLTGHSKSWSTMLASHQMAALLPGAYLFDNSVKLWDGHTGKFISSLRGHVAAVYQLSWSSDSRMLVSSSRDSTIKTVGHENQKAQARLGLDMLTKFLL